MADSPDERNISTRTHPRPNISTENQPKGAARRPSDTLDREPQRHPESGDTIPDDYDPQTMTRQGEDQDSRAGREAQDGDEPGGFSLNEASPGPRDASRVDLSGAQEMRYWTDRFSTSEARLTRTTTRSGAMSMP